MTNRQPVTPEPPVSSIPPPAGRDSVKTAFLDAAERLLVEVGYAQISTRRLADEAGANHGLIHYYFGSMEELFVQVLERFTERLLDRQRAMYARPVPFIEKWRTAWRYHEEDLAAGYPKVWLELQALAWNLPELRARVAHVNAEWRSVLTEAFSAALGEYGVNEATLPAEVAVALTMTFEHGAQVERLSGIDTGHAAIVAWIDRWLEEQESRLAARGREGGEEAA